jgi:hypothetical protein
VTLASRIGRILDLLSDGEWHGIEELTQVLNQPGHATEEVIAFLDKYEFAEVDVKNKRVKINKDFQELLELTST